MGTSDPSRPTDLAALARRQRRRRQTLVHALAYAGLAFIGVTMALPLLWMVSTSLKSPAAVVTYPPEFIPREQVIWRDPGTGREYPVFRCPPLELLGRRSLPGRGETCVVPRKNATVALLRYLPGEAEVKILDAGWEREPAIRVPLYTWEDGRQVPTLRPLKQVRPHFENYPRAWTAMRLQRGWLGFDFPYQVRVHLFGQTWQIGPWRWEGLPLRNAFLVFYLNSLLVAVTVTLGTLITSALAAFAFARLEFPGRNALFLTYLSTLMVPFVVTMIPIFALLKLLRLTDTYFALIVPVIFSAYGTFLLRQFFLAIPRDLEDAARLDGCGHLGVLRHVILPLSKPALATLGTFTFLGTWNSFMWPLIVINSEEKMPLMVGLYAFMGEYSAQWHLLMAASVMVMVPVILVFVLGQRYFIEGIVLSGMKG